MTTFHIILVPSEPGSLILLGAAEAGSRRQLQPKQLGAWGLCPGASSAQQLWAFTQRLNGFSGSAMLKKGLSSDLMQARRLMSTWKNEEGWKMSEQQKQDSVVALVTFTSSFSVPNIYARNQTTAQGSSHPLPHQYVSFWASPFEFPNPHQIYFNFARENDQALQDFLVQSLFSQAVKDEW